MYENHVVPLLQRRARNPRRQTSGLGLKKMIQAMGTRMPISVIEGNKGPPDPLQAAKFASEAGVVVRSQVPIFPHWKYYQQQPGLAHFSQFVTKLSVSMYVIC